MALLQVCLLLSITLLVKAQTGDVGVLPNCDLPDNIPPKPSASETDAHQLALCQSLCLERIVLLNATEMLLPGYPLWTLATQSYLISDMALMGRDCLAGDMSQCGQLDCGRFTNSFTNVLECKRGCVERLQNPTATNCATTCREDCVSECGSTLCFANRFPPCGLICQDFSGTVPCSTGCDVIDNEYSAIDAYPVEANPVVAPTVTKVPGTTAIYEVDIFGAVPSVDDVIGGYGTVIVRVQDVTGGGEFSYFTLENGTEIDLEAFSCREINISFAVATAMLNVSDYSPSVRIALGEQNLLPNCAVPSTAPDRPSISESDVNQAALCQAYCIDEALNMTDIMMLPGSSLWSLVTQSHLVSDMALMGRDCIINDGALCGGADARMCERFGRAFEKVALCKQGCMERYRDTSVSVNDCSSTCDTNCRSICPGGTCFTATFPPCGLVCSADVCNTGCAAFDSLSTTMYPSAANPTTPPSVTEVEGSVYNIDVFDSIPSTTATIVGGASSIVVRACDVLNESPNSCSYFFLENGTDIDLGAFACRRVDVSFAVATAMLGVSDYSPPATIEVIGEDVFPGQIENLTNRSVVQDPNRFQKTIIHIEWNRPQAIENAEQYVITMTTSRPSSTCGGERKIKINDTTITEYMIESGPELLSPPITGCPYDIQVEVLPRTSRDIPAKISVFGVPYTYPTNSDISVACSGQVSTVRNSYDIILRPVMFGRAFTPAIREAVAIFNVIIQETNDQQSFNDLRRSFDFSDFDRIQTEINNNPVQLRGNFFRVIYNLGWNSTLTPRPLLIGPITTSCVLRGLELIPPNPVLAESIKVDNETSRAFVNFDEDRIITGVRVELALSWSPPEFVGSGITSYEIWLDKMQAPDNLPVPSGRDLDRSIVPNTTIESTFSDEMTTDFMLNLQIRAIGEDNLALSPWSEPITLNVSDLDPPQPSPMTDTEFNITGYSYEIDKDNSDFNVNVNVSVEWTFPEFNDAPGGEQDIIGFDLWVGEEEITQDQEGQDLAISFSREDGQGGIFNMSVQRTVSNVQDTQTSLVVQMRATSLYDTSGEWSEPEQLTILSVSQPENGTASANDPVYGRDGLVNTVSVMVFATWSQALEGGSIGSTDVGDVGSGDGILGPVNMTDENNMTISPGVRRRRQSTDNIGSGSGMPSSNIMTVREPDEDIEGYEIVVGVTPLAQEFGSIPETTSTTHFRQVINNENTTRISFRTDDIAIENPDNVTLFFQIRTMDRFRGSSNWSEAVPFGVAAPPQAQRSQLPAIVGSTVPIVIILIIAIIVVIVIIGYIAVIQKKKRDEYKPTSDQEGVDVWAEQWSSVPFIAPGMIDGKGPYYDEWEIPTTEVIVEDHLGEGAFGFVFKGVIRGPLRNPKLSTQMKQAIGLPVAIKLLKDTASRKEKSDFLQEIEMMKKISEGYNNHIVNMVGCVTLQEPLCLITEFVPHGDLLDFLRTQRKKKAAKRRQETALTVQLEEQRKAYEEMRRKMELMQSAQSEDSGFLGKFTGDSGYELMALKEPAYPPTGPAYLESDPAYPELAGKNAAVEEESPQKSNDGYDKLVDKEAMMQENGEPPLTTITEEETQSGGSSRGGSPAPYLEASNEYSHLADKPQEQQQQEEEFEDQDPYAELGDLEANDLMQFAYQIATGMEYLASLNIVHRDLACRNILVGEGKNLKITDFGLSREVEEVYVKKTKGRLPLKWMALESIAEREFTTASDVWSYGVVLWEVGTVGGFPYPTIPNTDLLMMLKQGYRLEKPDNCAPEVYEIMLECWHEHPSDRPTFSQLRNKFSTLLLATTDDPYMVLEVDEAKAYYTAEELEENSKDRRDSVSSDDSDSSVKKGKKEAPKKPVWAAPSNAYVTTPAVTMETVAEGEEVVEESYIAMTSDPVPRESLKPLLKDEINQMASLDRTVSLPEGEALPSTSLQEATISASLPPQLMQMEQMSGVPISMLSKSDVAAHRPVTSRTRSNPYVDDPSTETLLPAEELGRSGSGVKLPVVSEEREHTVGNGTSDHDTVTAL